MYSSFNDMPSNSKVWIYQADRKLSDTERETLESNLKVFLNSWASHGNDLKSSGKVFHNQFLVILVDENQNMASGCSIDSSVAFVKESEKALKVNFFNRTKIAFLIEGEIYLEDLQKVKEKVSGGLIKKDTLTFNNLVADKASFDSNWTIPAKDSWLSRYF
ncbi:hypothetical protein [Xanthovirga aplysinae]|uniref:hypothetical protein n=1 Tax=Xanthovirga aplysinae TaxID=2529853 RepID=UPI0012BB6908|nr:hypothetical protein [Xanthovirga aplysinae]MTI29300.1 hypothetical protein [Xanthovirga aplysinae]